MACRIAVRDRGRRWTSLSISERDFLIEYTQELHLFDFRHAKSRLHIHPPTLRHATVELTYHDFQYNPDQYKSVTVVDPSLDILRQKIKKFPTKSFLINEQTNTRCNQIKKTNKELSFLRQVIETRNKKQTWVDYAIHTKFFPRISVSNDPNRSDRKAASQKYVPHEDVGRIYVLSEAVFFLLPTDKYAHLTVARSRLSDISPLKISRKIANVG